jgi:predicted branched-subunit amino acid permease
MFLCLLVYQLRGRLYVITAVMSGVLAITVALLVPGNAYVVIASLLAATAGFAMKRSAARQGGGK